MSNKIKTLRRVHNIDELIQYKLDRYSNSFYFDICDYSIEQFIGIVSEWVIEAMYYDWFSDIDDDSEEWQEIYSIMVNYIESVHLKTIVNFHKKHCSGK